MSTDKPVVVYGASGYTGQLICEYLREFDVPFIAAGRDKARIQEALDRVPGIETVPHEVVEVEHAVGAADRAAARRPGGVQHRRPVRPAGPEVVEASLAAGCHYLDTTGEQDWLIHCDETYGQQMADRGLLLAPGVAQMYTTGEIAACICLETPGLDTLDIEVLLEGPADDRLDPTILVNAALANAYYLEQNQYVQWPADGGLYDVVVPGQHETGLALPWGGTSHPVWFSRDPRVANVRVLGGVFNRALMQGVPQIVAAALEQIKDLADDEKVAALSEQAAAVDEPDAAAGEPAGQHLAGLGVRLRPARPGALRAARQLQLQADRAAAGVLRLLAAPAAAPAGRLRVRLPGVRAPRAARRAAQLRARHGAGPDRAQLTRGGELPCG